MTEKAGATANGRSAIAPEASLYLTMQTADIAPAPGLPIMLSAFTGGGGKGSGSYRQDRSIQDGQVRRLAFEVGPGGELAVGDGQAGTRFMIMAGKPYGETPIFNGPYVD